MYNYSIIGCSVNTQILSVVMSFYADDDSGEKADIIKLYNIIPYVEEKWLEIGTRLKVPQEILDNIGEKAYERKVALKSKNRFCCNQMLAHWHRNSKDNSVNTLIEAIKAPHIGLQSKISSIVDALNSSPLCLDTKKDIYEFVPEPPERHEQAYANMKADFCAELHTCSMESSTCSVDRAINFMKSNGTIISDHEQVKDFVDIVNWLDKHSHPRSRFLPWLERIASYCKCTKAIQIIEEYEQCYPINHPEEYKQCYPVNHPNGTVIDELPKP